MYCRIVVPRLKDVLSEAEQTMFRELGWEHSFEDHVHVLGFYSMVVENVFMYKKEGLPVDALRRAMLAIIKGYPSRGTQAFDELIEVHPVFNFDYDKYIEQERDKLNAKMS